jgi:aminoglycoside 3-N-acetyltransferase
MPALSYGDYGPDHPPPPFDPRTTPGIVGRIPERFRQRPGVQRSLHPTHSLAAIGARAAAILRDHELSLTPCGPESPWGHIARSGGSILMIGVGTQPCTMFHGAEEEAEMDARCTPPTPCRLVTAEGERTVWLRLHGPYTGALDNRAAMEPVLEAAGLLRRTKVGNSPLLRIEAAGLWELSLGMLRSKPGRALERRPGSHPAER